SCSVDINHVCCDHQQLLLRNVAAADIALADASSDLHQVSHAESLVPCNAVESSFGAKQVICSQQIIDQQWLQLIALCQHRAHISLFEGLDGQKLEERTEMSQVMKFRMRDFSRTCTNKAEVRVCHDRSRLLRHE